MVILNVFSSTFYNQHVNFKNGRVGGLVITGAPVTRFNQGEPLGYLTNGVMFEPLGTKFLDLGEGVQPKDITIYH